MSYGNQLFLWLSQYGQQASSNKRNQGQLKAIVELMRLDKPWGTILLLWPTMWALWLGNNGMPNAQMLLVFIIGGILMRACGCVLNDYCDQDIDAQVQRTKTRPLAAQVVSKKTTIGLAIVLALGALSLLPFLKLQTRYLALIGFLLTCMYPTTKRWLQCPQLFLGLTFAWGIPMAFSESVQGLNSTCWLLYATTAIWIIGYDTIYAMQDYDDDQKLAIFTMPKWLGGEIKPFIIYCYVGVILGIMTVAYVSALHRVFFIYCLLAFATLYYQYVLITGTSKNRYLQAFKLNQWVGLLIWMGIACAQQ